MQYTLDSVTHAKACLYEKFKKEAKEIPFLSNNTTGYIKEDNSFYFGVLTIGSNVSYAILYDENDTEIIRITTNSQIIEIFSSVKFFDSGDLEISNQMGQFRGYVINLD